MSVYLYAFIKRTRKGIHKLTFRRGNASDVECERLADRIHRANEDFELPAGTRFVIGAGQAGTLVYEAAERIVDPLWYDTDKEPGKAQVVGSLNADGTVNKYFAVFVSPARRDGMVRVDNETRSQKKKVLGFHFSDYEQAVKNANVHNQWARDTGWSTDYFEVGPN